MISTSEHNGRLEAPKPTAKPSVLISARVVDLCCGLGGMSVAARQLGMRVVADVDSNPVALKTFGRNFPDAEAIEGSVRSGKILNRCGGLLKPADGDVSVAVIISGPPCQGFSAAGSRDPKDRRNKVFISVARAIVELQPRCALIENVSMVLAEKHEDRMDRFEGVLAEGKYYVQRVLLDAAEFGVPQKRRRAFFLVTRNQLEEQVILKKLESHKTAPKGAAETFSDLPVPQVRPDDYDDEQSYGVVWNHLAMRHSRNVMDKIAAILPGAGPMSYRRLHPTRPSNTLFSGHRAPPAHFSEPRSITVREAARLQGFPDDFRVYGSFANQMEQVTNAVPPPLARTILRVLAEITDIAIHNDA